MRRRHIAVAIAVVALASAVGSRGWAADICGETVPANRFIDGLPAYAQCAGSMSGAVYSNNGIDTATTSGGAGWIRTQSSGGYQCTELAHRYLAFKWNIASVPNGNAGVWCNATLPAGLVKATTPVHGDLIVLAPGSCGADATTGHVAVIDVVDADSVMAVQQNTASRSRYNLTCAACFLHVAANDGSAADGGVPPVDAGGAMDAGGAGGRGGAMGSRGGAGGGAAGASGAGGTTGAGGVAGAISTGRGGDGASPTPDGAAGADTGGAGPPQTGVAGSAGGGPGATPDGAAGGCSIAGARGTLAPAGLLMAALAAITVRCRRRPPR